MSDLPVETTPGVAAPAHEAARGQIVYITEHGERLAAIVPAAVAAELERLSPAELAELLEDFAAYPVGSGQGGSWPVASGL